MSPSESLPDGIEKLLSIIVKKELALAGQTEMLKQDLAAAPDYNLDFCYKQIDDCNFGFIDMASLRRFLVKCCIYASDALLMAIVRRMDLDADCKLK